MTTALATKTESAIKPADFGLENLKDLPEESRSGLAFLLSFLHTINRFCLNRDAIWLALDEARTICIRSGVPVDHVQKAFDAYWNYNKQARRSNPMHVAYSEE